MTQRYTSWKVLLSHASQDQNSSPQIIERAMSVLPEAAKCMGKVEDYTFQWTNGILLIEPKFAGFPSIHFYDPEDPQEHARRIADTIPWNEGTDVLEEMPGALAFEYFSFDELLTPILGEHRFYSIEKEKVEPCEGPLVSGFVYSKSGVVVYLTEYLEVLDRLGLFQP